jgi:glutamate-1-semialdehyde 2,1-aminomutase
MSIRYAKSEQWLERSLKVIPLGSQTFSKSKTQYPVGAAPLYVSKAKGSHIWDVDGNEYIDFNSSLASINLGYCDPDVNAAVQEYLNKGTIFSLPHTLETEVAEEIQKLVPCAEMVRFGKNGSDATAGAIRLARAVTGRERVLVCGYHGWQDWYIGSTARNKGVPVSTRELTHIFPYNDIDAFRKELQKWKGNIAAVIMEPMNFMEPGKNYLEQLMEEARQAGALVVFDETITGFRFSLGGAQELFGLKPDLATLGKAMANGFPLSAVVGKAEYMKMMEEIFFSFTFGGETLSLAACQASLKKLQREPVLETIAKRGTLLKNQLAQILIESGLEETFSVSGHPSWVFLNIKEHKKYTSWQIKTLFLQEVFRRGILLIGTHNMSYSHSETDIEQLMKVYREVFVLLRDALENETLEKLLEVKALEPLFKIR